ncbi:MAG TPA: hypothetical protein VGD78_01225 [Chthoniobacterales bacterium]
MFASTLQAVGQLNAEGRQTRVVFVHDRNSGIKLFADKVWYVEKQGRLAALLLRESADAWAAKEGGEVLAYREPAATALRLTLASRLARAQRLWPRCAASTSHACWLIGRTCC